MVKVIMGNRGSGKTKQVIDLVNIAVNEEAGSVVCVEKGQNLRFNIKYSAKLIDISEYPMELGYDYLFAFLCGLYSGNYDITHFFIDDLNKILDDRSNEALEKFLAELTRFSERENTDFTITINADPAAASEGLKKYF